MLELSREEAMVKVKSMMFFNHREQTVVIFGTDDFDQVREAGLRGDMEEKIDRPDLEGSKRQLLKRTEGSRQAALV